MTKKKGHYWTKWSKDKRFKIVGKIGRKRVTLIMVKS